MYKTSLYPYKRQFFRNLQCKILPQGGSGVTQMLSPALGRLVTFLLCKPFMDGIRELS